MTSMFDYSLKYMTDNSEEDTGYFIKEVDKEKHLLEIDWRPVDLVELRASEIEFHNTVFESDEGSSRSVIRANLSVIHKPYLNLEEEVDFSILGTQKSLVNLELYVCVSPKGIKHENACDLFVSEDGFYLSVRLAAERFDDLVTSLRQSPDRYLYVNLRAPKLFYGEFGEVSRAGLKIFPAAKAGVSSEDKLPFLIGFPESWKQLQIEPSLEGWFLDVRSNQVRLSSRESFSNEVLKQTLNQIHEKIDLRQQEIQWKLDDTVSWIARLKSEQETTNTYLGWFKHLAIILVVVIVVWFVLRRL